MPASPSFPALPYRPKRSTPTPLAIMQGRLVPPEGGRFQSFPRERWRDEFRLAVDAGIQAIEWIVDTFGEDLNPALSDAGRHQLQQLKQQHQIHIPGVCADWFMDLPLLRATPSQLSDRTRFLHALIPHAQTIGARYIVLPFVDAARIETAGDKDTLVHVLTLAAPVAASHSIELHLETDLKPRDFLHLLDRLPHPAIKANYDSGNSSGIGYRASEEWAAYGHRVGSVHIKDRFRKPEGGIETRALGQGSADFDDLFAAMHRASYNRGLTLQVARGDDGNEVNWIREQAAFVRRHWA